MGGALPSKLNMDRYGTWNVETCRQNTKLQTFLLRFPVLCSKEVMPMRMASCRNRSFFKSHKTRMLSGLWRRTISTVTSLLPIQTLLGTWLETLVHHVFRCIPCMPCMNLLTCSIRGRHLVLMFWPCRFGCMVDHIAFRLKPRKREGLLALFFFCSTMMYHGMFVLLVCTPRHFCSFQDWVRRHHFRGRRGDQNLTLSHFTYFFNSFDVLQLHKIHNKQISKFSSLRRAKAKMMPNLSFLSRTLWKNLSNQFINLERN